MTTDEIIKECIELDPAWLDNINTLRGIVNMANINLDGNKRILLNGNVYLVPISTIICKGIKAVDLNKYPKEVR